MGQSPSQKFGSILEAAGAGKIVKKPLFNSASRPAHQYRRTSFRFDRLQFQGGVGFADLHKPTLFDLAQDSMRLSET
jgi:hypothetical protein